MAAQGIVNSGEAENKDQDWMADLFPDLFHDSETDLVDWLIERAGKTPPQP
jgi:hypothetical protein